jgi:hypothetical protein
MMISDTMIDIDQYIPEATAVGKAVKAQAMNGW